MVVEKLYSQRIKLPISGRRGSRNSSSGWDQTLLRISDPEDSGRIFEVEIDPEKQWLVGGMRGMRRWKSPPRKVQVRYHRGLFGIPWIEGSGMRFEQKSTDFDLEGDEGKVQLVIVMPCPDERARPALAALKELKARFPWSGGDLRVWFVMACSFLDPTTFSWNDELHHDVDGGTGGSFLYWIARNVRWPVPGHTVLFSRQGDILHTTEKIQELVTPPVLAALEAALAAPH